MSLLNNFREKYVIDEVSGCWVWTGSRNEDGYGNFWMGKKCAKAHRASLVLIGASVPSNMEVDHLCNRRDCVNPTHLRIVTRAENHNRVVWPNSQKTHCANGHAFDEGNTLWRKDGKSRQCRTCTRNRMRLKRGSIMHGINWRSLVTHCIRGHPLSGDNLHIHPSSGKRVCKICRRQRVATRRTAESSARAMMRG